MALRHRFHQRLRQELSPSREPVTELPDLVHLNCQTVRFATERGRMLEGWWLTGEAAQGQVILTHGWGANRQALLPLVPMLVAAGWNVLLFDVRNHGNSDEDTFSSMPRFAEDIDAAIAWLNNTQGKCPIALIGHSVGAAATLLAASRRNDITAVVSLSSFAHPADMMKRWLVEKGIPFYPLGWYVLRYVQRVIGYRFDSIAPVDTLTRIHCPVLLVHGDRDTIIPLEDAYTLASKTNNAVLRVVPGGHDLSPSIAQHGDELVAFLHDALKPDSDSRHQQLHHHADYL
ncbi:alpha/beta fold hydrolase [Nitrincola iocasae]|uniref:Alpha/beta fold hydrolase n=2 Tax=Nitrincola iocasae TaxID=2614693 RepID=A0A5J6LJC3_9GAMM|nr:alpha/beta fold hydrolase [Nitrincola iocasae]